MRGASTMREYWRDPEGTRAAFVDGFVRTTLASACNTPPAAPAQQAAPMQQAPQVAAPPPPPSEAQLSCLRAELARRTHAKH